MDQQGQGPIPSNNQMSQNTAQATTPSLPASSYGLPQNSSQLEDLTVHQQGAVTGSVVSKPTGAGSKFRFVSFSKRKAMVVSLVIALVVAAVSAVSIILLGRRAPDNQALKNNTIKSQDVTLKDANLSNLPAEIQGGAKSLFVNGDIITRGVLKVSNGGFSSVVSTKLTANQALSLPDATGTICIDSNNCGYATAAQLTQVRALTGGGVSSLQGQTGAITFTSGDGIIIDGTTISNSGVLSVGGQTGALNVGLGLTASGNTLTNSGVVNLTSPNGSININNAGNGVYELTVGPTSGGVALGPVARQDDPSNNSSIHINKTGTGNLLQFAVNGADKFILGQSGVIGRAYGGTGVGTAPANGQLLIGNGTTSGYNLANITSGTAGIEIVNGAGSIRIDAPGLGECDICANNNLNNLENTLINVDLKPGAAGGVSLGTAASPFSALRISGTSAQPATNNFLITGASTSGLRTITLPDASGTVCINTNNCGYINLQTSSPGSQQTGNINVNGIIIAGTSLQAPLLKTADSTSTTTAAIALRSGDATAGNNGSGNVTIDAGAKSGTGLAGSIVIAGTNATGLTLGRGALDVLIPGTLNSQTISATSNFTGTVAIQGANALTLGSGANVGAIKFNTNGTNFITLKSPTTGNFSLTLPSALPAGTECLNLSNAGVIGTQGCSSGLGGSGTANTIALFGAGGTSVADSLLTQSGTVINLLGATNNATLAVGTSVTVGANGATNPVTGALILNDGSNPGRAITLKAQQVGSSYTLQLPTTSDVGTTCLKLENVAAGVNKIVGGSCAAGGTGGNITATGSSTNTKLVRFTNDGVGGYTADASMIQDNTSGIGINTAPQANTLLTVGSANAFKVTDAGAISASASIASSGLIQTTAGTQALTLSGAPAPGTGITSLLQLGNAISGGNTAANGGTYLGLNAPNAGTGSAADFVNFQKNSTSEFLINNSGDVTGGTYNGLALQSNATGFQIAGGTAPRTLTVSASSTIDQNLSTASAVSFGSLSLGTALGIGSGGTGTGTTPTNGQLLIGNGTNYTLATLTQGSGITITNGVGSITIAASGGGGGACASCATRELNNLQNVAINTHLTAGAIGATAGIDLGSSTTPFRDLYLSGADTNGADLFKFTGDASQDRIITIPDLDGTIALVRSSASSSQAGSINIDGTLTAGTTLESPLLQTANSSTTATANLSIRSGNATGGSFNSGNLSLDVGSATATAGTITVGATNASALILGRTDLATTIAGNLNFTTGANRTINVANATVGNGNNLTLQAGNAFTTGNTDGGDLYLLGGTRNGTGVTGDIHLAVTSGGVAQGRVGIGTNALGSATDLLIVAGTAKIQGSGVAATLALGTASTAGIASVAEGRLLFQGGNASTATLRASNATTAATLDWILPATATAGDNRRCLGFDNNANQIKYLECLTGGSGGSSFNRTASIVPEYVGAVLNGTGIGTFTADFCANTAGNIPNTNGTICAVGEKRNYYSWTTSQNSNQSYDIWVRYQIPDDFVKFSTASGVDADANNHSIKIVGWRTDLSQSVKATLYNAGGTVCGTADREVAITNATWTNVFYGTGTTTDGAGINENACGITAGSMVTFRINMTANSIDSTKFARVGDIIFNYKNGF